MLDGLFVTPAVTAIDEALASAGVDGANGRAGRSIVVVGDAKLAAALAAKREVIVVGVSARAAKKLGPCLADTSSIEAGSVAAVIGSDPGDATAWRTTAREWGRILVDGGVLVRIDKGHAPEASRRALCAGLTEIEQRHAGRTVITSGLVTHPG